MNTIKFRNVSLTLNKRKVLKDINFYLPKNKTLSIIGPSASGKSMLLKLLKNEYEYNGEIVIDKTLLGDKNGMDLQKIISVINEDVLFNTDIVKDELEFYLKKRNLSDTEIKDSIDTVNEYFSLKGIMKKKICDLDLNNKYLVKILSYAIIEPNYLALDDLLINLNNRTKILLINYIHSMGINLINVTSNMDDALYTDYCICLYNGVIAVDGNTIDVFKEEKLIKRLGLNLPFMMDLSIQLQLYNLINKMYFSKEEMVDRLWK